MGYLGRNTKEVHWFDKRGARKVFWGNVNYKLSASEEVYEGKATSGGGKAQGNQGKPGTK